MKKIIFMGTPQFAVEVLEGLMASQYEVVAVVTQPDRPVGRKKKLTPPPVKEAAQKYGLPIFQPEKLSGSAEQDTLLQLSADLIVTAAYGQYVPTVLLEAPPYKAINVHGSLLPKYRGGAPIQYALWQGESETGITIMYMVKEMDAGDILAQKPLTIEDTDDTGSLFTKLAELGRELLLETLPRLFANEIQPLEQDTNLVTYSPTLKREQEQIDWSQTAQEIDRHIRAFRPAPSTHTWLNGQRLKVWAGYPKTDQSQTEVGKILAVEDDAVLVQCGQGSVFAITEWQESGKKRLTIEQWLNGNSPDAIIGEVFEVKE